MTTEQPGIPIENFNEIVNDALQKSIEEKKKTLSSDVLEKIKKLEELREECREWITEVKKENECIHNALKEFIPSLKSTAEMISREIADTTLIENRKEKCGYTHPLDKDWIELRRTTVAAKALEFVQMNLHLQRFINILDKYISLIGD